MDLGFVNASNSGHLWTVHVVISYMLHSCLRMYIIYCVYLLYILHDEATELMSHRVFIDILR